VLLGQPVRQGIRVRRILDAGGHLLGELVKRSLAGGTAMDPEVIARCSPVTPATAAWPR
jgi:hypothetical protein